ITGRDKDTRMWYLERTVDEVLNGDGSIPSTDMFAKFPQTPSASTPATPGGNRGPRRRIRCKMCRTCSSGTHARSRSNRTGNARKYYTCCFSKALNQCTHLTIITKSFIIDVTRQSGYFYSTASVNEPSEGWLFVRYQTSEAFRTRHGCSFDEHTRWREGK
ncbi:hypothetical protein MPER_15209, partial [Moniliophthora perniciosa FA553]